MQFYNAVPNIPRPVRLSESIRQAALDSLNGKYGLEALQYDSVSVDDVPGFAEMSRQQQYDVCIRRIAEQAPVRITPWETVSGSATLGMAIGHLVPAKFQGKTVTESVSHITPGFDEVLRRGIDDYAREVEQRLQDPALDGSQIETLRGMQNVIECIHIYHDRCRKALEDAGRTDILAYFPNVPFAPPENFKEAVQALWFMFAFTRLMGNWPGLGRIDWMLNPYLEKDLENGVLTPDEAREFFASFFVKGCEWITQKEVGSGDGQHYQNIVLGGVDPEGRDICGPVTRLTLEILEELPIGDFPVAVRINKDTPEWVFSLIANNTVHGGGVVAVYNEDLIIDSMVRFGYSLYDARHFANDGCWEVQVPGCTCFGYRPFDAYRVFQKEVLHLDADTAPDYADFDEMYAAYIRALQKTVAGVHEEIDDFHRDVACSVIDLLEDGCIRNARSYYQKGPRFTVRSPHIGGFPDAVNALMTMKKVIYEQTEGLPHLTLAEFWQILRDNWENAEPVRRAIRARVPMYGNDLDEPDELAKKIFDAYLDAVELVHERCGILRPAGSSTFGRQINWAPDRFAAPHGFKEGVFLASNMCPTPDTDTQGASAVIRSFCKLDISRLTCGTALELKLNPQMLTPGHYESIITTLFRSFVTLGGFFLQMDVIDNEVLKKAQENPDAYRNLSVRISGWSARFVTLDRDWQNMIIERSTQNK